MSELRKMHTDAIADLAVENFIEMRDLVGHPDNIGAPEIVEAGEVGAHLVGRSPCGWTRFSIPALFASRGSRTRT